MNKNILLLAALIGISSLSQVTAISIENLHQEYNFWLEEFNEMNEGMLKEITLSDSFANKQVIWYLMDTVLHKEKMELTEGISYALTEKNYPNYHLTIEIYSNKIQAVNNALAQLDHAVSLVEKQFSIPSGQFKVKAIEFAESQDLLNFVDTYIPLSD
jgi:DNA mismatch repair ATPase MutS